MGSISFPLRHFLNSFNISEPHYSLLVFRFLCFLPLYSVFFFFNYHSLFCNPNTNPRVNPLVNVVSININTLYHICITQKSTLMVEWIRWIFYSSPFQQQLHTEYKSTSKYCIQGIVIPFKNSSIHGLLLCNSILNSRVPIMTGSFFSDCGSRSAMWEASTSAWKLAVGVNTT